MLETLATIEAHAHAVVTAQTFGHLAPKPKKVYEGWILFALTAFGDTCVIDFEFENLSESPWFNLDVVDHISNYTDQLPKDKNFGVFKWNGCFEKSKKGDAKFDGQFVEIDCL